MPSMKKFDAILLSLLLLLSLAYSNTHIHNAEDHHDDHHGEIKYLDCSFVYVQHINDSIDIIASIDIEILSSRLNTIITHNYIAPLIEIQKLVEPRAPPVLFS